MAKNGFTFLFVNKDVNAVSMVIPALGPSLGMAPSGTCTWIVSFSNTLFSMPSFFALAFINVKAACADSFITSPNWPVSFKPSLPSYLMVSMYRISPPTGVHANPTATPGGICSLYISRSYLALPKMFSIFSAVTFTSYSSSNATDLAVFRITDAICLSNSLTPLSRV